MICFALAKSGRFEGRSVRLDENDNARADESQAAFWMMVKYVLPMGVRGMAAGLPGANLVLTRR